MKTQNKAFTLVELIIVITILAILATIGFISYQSYTTDARDGKRKADLGELRNGLEIYVAKNSTLPTPDSQMVTTLDASGNTVSIQGYAGANVLKTLRAAGDIKDSYDNSYYTYSVNGAKTKYQLLGLLENNTALALNDNKILNETYARDYTSRYPYTTGNKVGIFFTGTTNTPLQEVMSGTLALSGVTTKMRVMFSNLPVTSTGYIDATGSSLPAIIQTETNTIATLINNIQSQSQPQPPSQNESFGGSAYINHGGSNSSLGLGSGIIYKTIAVGNTLYSVGGDSGMGLRKSIDYGKNWTALSALNLTQVKLYDLIWTGNKFWGVGYDSTAGANKGFIAESSDGITWTIRNSGITVAIESIATDGNNLLVATSNVGTNSILYSTDGGITWLTTSIATSTTGKKVSYGNGIFVVATGDNKLFTSTDGITWTQRATNITKYGLEFNNGKFIAVSYSTSYPSIYSTDGINWNNSTGDKLSGDGYLTIVDSTRLVYHTSSISDYLISYDNGISWIKKTNKNISYTGTYSQMYRGCYLNGYIIIGTNAGFVITTNIEKWDGTVSLYYAGVPIGATNGNGNFIIGLTSSYAGGNIYFSTNRFNWYMTNGQACSTVEVRGLLYGNGFFLSYRSNGSIYKSIDGKTWIPTAIFTGTKDIISAPTYNKSFRYLNNKFIAGTKYSTTSDIIVSTDGITWTTYITPFTGDITSVNYGLGYYIFSVNGYKYYKTTDFVTFTEFIMPITNSSINEIITIGNTLYFVMVNGAVYSTVDLASFINIPQTGTITSVEFIDGIIYLGYSDTSLKTTTNFSTYTTINTAINKGPVTSIIGSGDKIFYGNGSIFLSSGPAGIDRLK